MAMAEAIDSLPRDKFDMVAPAVKRRALARNVDMHLDKLLDKANLPNRKKYGDHQRRTLDLLLNRMKKEPALLREIEQEPAVDNDLKNYINEELNKN